MKLNLLPNSKAVVYGVLVDDMYVFLPFPRESKEVSRLGKVLGKIL